MGGRRWREVEGEIAAVAAAVVAVVVAVVAAAVAVVTVVWFMACRKSTKNCWGCTRLFLLFYIGLKRQ